MFSILKNIVYYWKSHLVVFLSIALACAVIVASLIVGDSLSHTLEYKAMNRLGKVESSVSKFGSVSNTNIAGAHISSVLSLDAIVVANGLSRAVKLYVVDDKFWKLSPNSSLGKSTNSIFINDTFSKAFNLEKPSRIALRFAFRASNTAEIPLSDSKSNMHLASFDDFKVIEDKDFADFYLYDWQNSPPNIFMPYKIFLERFDLGEIANLFLSSDANILSSFKPNFENLGLSCDEFHSGYILKSGDVFINEELSGFFDGSKNTLSWFVSKISFGKSQDYNAFIVGVGDDLKKNEVEINDVYAAQHSLQIGDFVELSYYTFDEKLNLKTSIASLKIAKISPINEGYFIKEIVPEYDGLTNVDDCTKWKSSIPIDLKKITEADKDYWAKYSSTPKFRISYNLATELFADSKEKSTALIVNYDPRSLDFSKINLQKLGFIPSSPKLNSLENARNGVDFKGLFLGLSFFVIFNALLLIALILKMNLTTRFEEISLFKSLGIRKKQIDGFYLKEFFFSVVLGAVAGLILGFAFARVLLFMINSIWSDISGGANIIFDFKNVSLVLAFVSSALLGFVVIKILLSRFFSARILNLRRLSKYTIPHISLLFLCFLSVLFVGIFLEMPIGYKAMLSLIAYALGLYLSIAIFRRVGKLGSAWGYTNFVVIGISNTFSGSVYLILSLGVYILCVVGLNKIDTTKNISEYTYQVKTVVGTKVPEQDDFDILALSLKDGAMANCLNLNKLSQAQVLGADIEALKSAKVISLKSRYEGEIAEDVVEMYVDESSMIWSLKAKLGDEFDYETQKAKVKLKIVGTLNPSVFQGSFIVSNKDFKDLWTSIDGYNLFLARPKGEAGKVELSKLFSDYLADVDETKSILAKFDSLQNAYLKIFYQLGVLGLLLGVLGSLISTRSRLLKDWQALSTLHLLGLRRSQISALILAEYILLNASATLLGIVASLPLIKISDNYLKSFIIFSIIVVLNLFLYPIVKNLLARAKFRY